MLALMILSLGPEQAVGHNLVLIELVDDGGGVRRGLVGVDDNL